MKKSIAYSFCVLLTCAVAECLSIHAAEFSSDFKNANNRVWLGQDYWANPMEDWRIQNGRAECLSTGPNRNVHLLTQQLTNKKANFTFSMRTGLLTAGKAVGSTGFRIGIHDEQVPDHRGWLIYGSGLNVGVTSDGSLFIGKTRKKNAVPMKQLKDMRLSLRAAAARSGHSYALTLGVADAAGKKIAEMDYICKDGPDLYGNVAFVNNHIGGAGGMGKGKKKGKKQGKGPGPRFWFSDLRVSGDKVEANNGQAFGPICWSMYTLSRNVLKMTAQMPPIGKDDSQEVRLQLKSSAGWKTISTAKIAPLSFTATFRVAKWNDKKDTPYRLAYTTQKKDGAKGEAYWTGTVRKDPVEKKSLVVAGFTGNADYGFPNLQLVKNVTHINPDMLFYSGDQIYEYVGGYGILRTAQNSVIRACLNYLRKWFLVGLAYRELMRDRPSISIPDDHDVYQGNIWGNGGIPITLKMHDAGGYVEHRDFINCVHRTQTSHLPDPYDPTPIKQNISVYYSSLVYGRVGFAIISDRMFKSGPRNVATWPGRPDHLKDPNYDLKKLDKPGLKMLGDRQLKFLREWAADWKGVDMKCVLSQTNFCNVANYHGGNRMYLVADLDSGSWPQSARNRALAEMRKGFAFHYNGDQHLATIVHYGINEPGDAGFSFCVPSIANFYPRRWIPDEEGKKAKNRPKNGLPNTGDYIDGLGNHIRVHAVGNPKEKYRPGRLPSLHDKASGFGIIRFNHAKQTITMECYRLLVDVTKPNKDNQFPGWPMTIKMTDNYGRKAKGHLPTVRVKGMTNPVVQVIDEKNKKIVYTLRINGNEYRPKVFAAGPYTVKVGELETDRVRVFQSVRIAENDGAVLNVDFATK